MKNAIRYLFLTALIGLGLRLQAASIIQFATTGYTVAEDVGAVTLTVQRLDDTNSLVSVDYATADGTATNGLKYTAVAGTLTFTPGATNQIIVVPILNEGFVEGIKSFQVILSKPTGGAVLGDRTTAMVNIRDNDTGLQFEFGSYSVAEDAGSVLIGILRGNDGNFALTVDYATTNLTATAGQDYTETKGTLAFAAGETVKLFTVPILNDGLKESSKTFRLTLGNPTGGGVLGTQKTATVTILDNDKGVQFEYNKYWIQENEGLFTLKVVRGNDIDLPAFTVDYATSNLTATAGEDYMDTKETLAFAEGETFKVLSVPILWNQNSELDKQFKLILSNPSAGVVFGTKQTATVVVLDMTDMEAHRFDGIAVLPDRSTQLTLGGSVNKRFKDYFDLYPIEVSTNLVDWKPLVTLQRTNSSTNALIYADSEAATADRRFYRTVTNHLITPFTKPPGPFPVGITSRLVTDPTRRNRYGVSTNGSFMVSIWYPAVAQAGTLPAPLEDPPLMQDPAWWVGRLMDREPYFMSHALPNVRCATVQAPYPVVVYSPSRTGVRTEVEDMGPYLASCGYLVVSMDHFDAYGTVFPDGSYLPGDPAAVSTATPAGALDRIRDVQFVLDELPRWNDSDPLFVGRMDLGKVATMGYSWGGETAAEIGRIEARCKAVIAIDSPFTLTPEVMQQGLQIPCAILYGSFGSGLYNKLTKDAILVGLGSTDHNLFCDQYWLYAHASLTTGREINRTMHAYSLWFLNKYLKGINDPVPSPSDYPLVKNFKQK